MILKEFFRNSIRYRFALPVCAGIFVVLSLPPLGYTPFVFLGVGALYGAFRMSTTYMEAFWAGAIFGFVLLGNSVAFIFSGFQWEQPFYLFTVLINVLSVVGVLFGAVCFALFGMLIHFVRRWGSSVQVVVFAVIYTALGAVFTFILGGYNTTALVYAILPNDVLRPLIAVFTNNGSVLVVLIASAASVEMIRRFFSKEKKTNFFLLVVCVGVIFALIPSAYYLEKTGPENETDNLTKVRFALIQDANYNESTLYGRVQDDEFVFPNLERYVEESLSLDADIIVFPFSPWKGIFSGGDKGSLAENQIIAMYADIFQDWIDEYIPEDVTFVTWQTSYLEDKFYNEIVYWQANKNRFSYKKRNLYPFFDYTPSWSSKIGVYSMPYDVSSGKNTVPYMTKNTAIGSLICSEVSNEKTSRENSDQSDIILAIGSEAFLAHSVLNEFNLLNTQLRAIETKQISVRSNKFGPSAVFGPKGNVLAYLAYRQSGVLLVEVGI